MFSSGNHINYTHTIKTTLLIGPTSLDNNRRAKTACSTISEVDKFLFKPILQIDSCTIKGSQFKSCKLEKQPNCYSLPASVAKLAIHGTTYLTRYTDGVPAPLTRYQNSFYHQTIFQLE